ncbi:hypothetical protein [Bacillus atrophaeus]|uniref:hypothetical protein n=1 Tax=Bacillus atrophaeus TaxID=1452 RepID=UPI003F5AAD42
MSKHYFEVSEPYYALIKADSGEEAEKIYNEKVADTDDYEDFQEEIKEVGREYALNEYLRLMRKAFDADDNLIMETFNVPASEILIWDGSLL